MDRWQLPGEGGHALGVGLLAGGASSCERCCVGDSGRGDVVGERQSRSDEKALDSVVLGDRGLRPAVHRRLSPGPSLVLLLSAPQHLTASIPLLRSAKDKPANALHGCSLTCAHAANYLVVKRWSNRAHRTATDKVGIA